MRIDPLVHVAFYYILHVFIRTLDDRLLPWLQTGEWEGQNSVHLRSSVRKECVLRYFAIDANGYHPVM